MRVALLDLMAGSRLPAPWRLSLASALQDPSAAIRAQAVRTAAILQVADLDEALARIAGEANDTHAVRREAVRAIIARRPMLTDLEFELVLSGLRVTDPLSRLASAEILRRAKLSAEQSQAGEKVLLVDPLLAAPPASPPDPAHLMRFEPSLKGGDPERGRVVFSSPKVACSSCHRIGKAGGVVGPDLTRVGAIRSGRDLLESILYPSSTFAQGYDRYIVATTDGRVLDGLVARQSDEAVVLRDAGGAESRIKRGDIRDMKRQAASMMPEGLERSLSEGEFRDLLAFLQSLR